MPRYCYNPGRAPQFYGARPFAPQNYAVLTDQEVEQIKAACIPLVLEGDLTFPPLWKHYNGQEPEP